MRRPENVPAPLVQPQPGDPEALLPEVSYRGHRFAVTQGRSVGETLESAQRIVEGAKPGSEEKVVPDGDASQPEWRWGPPGTRHPSLRGAGDWLWNLMQRES